MAKIKKYKIEPENEFAPVISDLISLPASLDLFHNNGENEREEEGTLRVLSLFSGCGGMDLGLEGCFLCHKKSVGNPHWIDRTMNDDWVLLQRNRMRTVFACDILPEARFTWLKYFQRFYVSTDIFHLNSVVDLVKIHKDTNNIFPQNIDIVTGGFPCQDFSVAGKRKGFNSNVSHNGEHINETNEENRGKLYLWMKQVIDQVQPKMFIAENVKGLVSLGDVKEIIQNDFSSAGENDYIVLTPQILHAGNYGVPESRERVIFIGIKKSALRPEALEALKQEKIPEEYDPYPKPTHNYTVNDEHLLPPVTCRDVLGKLQEPENSKDLAQQFFSKARYLSNGSQGQTEINMNGLGPTIRSEHHGNIEFRRLSAEHGGKNLEELQEGKNERRLTPRECALIQTFPPDYPFVIKKTYSSGYRVSPSSAYKVIGNAVPPIMAYNIAKRIEAVWPLYFYDNQ